LKTSPRKVTRPLLLLILLLVVVAAGCTSRIGTSWPVLGTTEMNGRTRIIVGYNTILALLDPSNGSVAQLEDAEGRVRTDENGNPRRWLVDGGSMEKAEFFGRPVALEDGYMLFPSHNNRLLKVDMLGARVEDVKGIPLNNPVITDLAASDDIIYAPLQFGDVVALDRDTFSEVWRAPVTGGVWSAPVIQDGVMYVAGVNHFLYAFDAETGKALWTEPVDLGGVAGASPLVTEDAIYIGSFAHKLFKISKEGQVLGTFEGNNWFWSTPVLIDGTIYATDLGGYVYAVNAEDMTQIWGLKVAGRGIRPSPIVSGDYVVAASRDGSVYWLNRETGELIKRYEIEGHPEILSDMLLLEPSDTLQISEPLIVVGTSDTGKLAVAFPLNPESGYQGWIYSR
jgi:outer membrane protein assembly factor BamB